LRLSEDGCACLAGHTPVYTIAAVTAYPWIQRERVRFRDVDAMGHVNNAVYSTYLEQARIGILGGLEPFILARVEIDFRAQLEEGAEVEVRSRCSHVGTKSFELQHEIWSADRLVAEAKSVLVGYDYERSLSVPISDHLRRTLTT
jgi:acyl-CoA thioester hydrolase